MTEPERPEFCVHDWPAGGTAYCYLCRAPVHPDKLASMFQGSLPDPDAQELREAREWVEAHWTPDHDEPATVPIALQQIFSWGDGAWEVAGRAEERQLRLVGDMRMVGGLLEFEGNVNEALQIVHDALAHNPARWETVTVDPSFADWTPPCWQCKLPIGDWQNALMLPSSDVPDDEPNGVVFVHRACP